MFKHTAGIHPYVVDIRTKRFESSFLVRTAKDWNMSAASVFPSKYDVGASKSRVNRHLQS
ncbi:hypothetical protein RR48_00627 [Papilio machaon]|uniref:Uncharacterized protein n=1 Tax=Papilio machaon TaxID=76193 RepID=A0A0N1IQT2_PAPMA|nr:hypothetical protein RR48_00627 [Papilio machaon]